MLSNTFFLQYIGRVAENKELIYLNFTPISHYILVFY